MSTLATITIDMNFIEEYKQHLINNFNDKMNYYLFTTPSNLIATRLEPATGDERPIDEIFTTYELQYDTSISYLEILQPLISLSQLHTVTTSVPPISTVVFRKTDLKLIVGFFDRVHKLIKAAPPTEELPDLLQCTVISRNDNALVLQVSDSLRQYVQSFAGHPLGTNKSLDKLLKDRIVQRLDAFLLSSVLGYVVPINLTTLYVNHYIDHCRYLDEQDTVNYPIVGDYKLIKKISLLPIKTDTTLANMLGVTSKHTLRILTVPGLSFAWVPDGTTVLRCWKEQLSIKIAFVTISPNIRCITLMPKMSHYLPYEGEIT